MKSGMIFMGLGFELVGLVLGCIYIGGVIDEHMGWGGYASVSLILISTIGWLVHLIIILKKFQENNSTTEGENH